MESNECGGRQSVGECLNRKYEERREEELWWYWWGERETEGKGEGRIK